MKIQNLLPPSLETILYNNLTDFNFPWYWNDRVSYEGSEENLFQFTHLFIKNGENFSNWANLIAPIVYFFEKQTNIKIKSIFRLKANLTTRTIVTESDIKKLYHLDIDKGINSDNYISFVYYVNDSDGDTIVNEKSFSPERNSLVWFKSDILHAGMFPQINKRRIIINAILEI